MMTDKGKTSRHLFLRAGTWYLKRKVPKRFRSVEHREVIWRALSARSESAAAQEGLRIWAGLAVKWQTLLDGLYGTEIQGAAATSQMLGFRFLSPDLVAQLPLEELLDRIEAVVDANGAIHLDTAAAVLGGALGGLRLSECLERFLIYSEGNRLRRSPRQVAQWINARRHAMASLIRVIGDIDVQFLTAPDLFRARITWFDESGRQMSPITINNRLLRIGEILDLVSFREGWVLKSNPKLALLRGQFFRRSRPSFSSEWIAGKILAPGSLDGLDLEARCILLALVNTGCRLSEIANLMPEEIRVQGSLPHIRLTGAFRPLKTSAAYRDVPLFGVSLEALRMCPKGFPTYRDRSSLSAKLNTYLRTNGLRESPEHSVHSLRHSFEDRVSALLISERLRCDLMGHRYGRAAYGRGSTLEMKAAVLEKISFGVTT